MDEQKKDQKQKESKPEKKKEVENGAEKSNSTRSNSTTGSRKKSKKQEWEKYFCYISDKEREQMMKLPDLPQKKKTKTKRKLRRSKSVGINKSASANSTAQINEEKENDKIKRKLDVEVKKKPIAAPFSAARTNALKSTTITKEQKDDTNISDALDSLHIKPSYKYLMRSMKANIDQYLRIKEYTNRSYINTQDYIDYANRVRINTNF